MSTPVVTIRADATYKQAVELLLGREVGSLPVLGENGAVVGVVSESDLLVKVALVEDAVRPGLLAGPGRRRALVQAATDSVRALMSSPARTVCEDVTIVEAARAMRDHDVKHLPVLDREGALVGIVARADLLQDYLRSDEQIHADVVRDVVEGALATAPTDVSVTVADGVVTLSGRLEHASLIPFAVRLARTVRGAVAVVNRLTAPPEAGAVPHPPYGPLRA